MEKFLKNASEGNLLAASPLGKGYLEVHLIYIFLDREIDFKDKFSSEIFLELRNLVEMSETKSLVAKIENNDWKFMHFFASCVLGAGTNTSITLNPSIYSFQFCVIVVIKYFISHLK